MLKIFCIYHKKAPLWKSDCVIPIQSGCALTAENLGILQDNIGDNISIKNKNYAEMTVWYWVWKNYLPAHPELEYVGFCHYRRFLAFYNKKYKKSWNKIYLNDFFKKFNKYYNNKNIIPFLKEDIILPKKLYLKNLTLRQSYDRYHPHKDMEKFIEIVLNKYPTYKSVIVNTLSKKEGYFCLNFIMRKEIFISFMEWVFPLIETLEKESCWNNYTGYDELRVPAYLVERFFNVWLNIYSETHKTTICELPGLFLVPTPAWWKFCCRPFLFLFPRTIRKEIKQKWFNNDIVTKS